MSTEAPTVTSEAGEAWRQLRALATDPEVLARLREEFEALGLTLGVAKALLRMSPTEPNAMRQLAGALHCDNSYVTTVVDALEERGLARREAHPRDRRVKVVVLTPEGAAAWEQVQAVAGTPPAWFAALTAEEAAQLNTLLRKLEAGRSSAAAGS